MLFFTHTVSTEGAFTRRCVERKRGHNSRQREIDKPIKCEEFCPFPLILIRMQETRQMREGQPFAVI